MDTSHDTTPQAATPMEKAQDRGNNLRERSQEFGARTQEKAQEIGTRAQEATSDTYQQGRQRAQELEAEIVLYVRDRPIQSLLIAGGVGFVFGWLLRR